MRLKVGSATDVGRVRPINEDAFFVDANTGLFVVCDGMGGAAAGEVASRLAVDTISAAIAGKPPNGTRDSQFNPRTRQLGDAIRRANLAIIHRSRQNHRHAGMGTTVVGAWVDNGVVSVAHVGDSRAYLASKQGFESITTDHSLVEAQVKAGLIDRAQSLQSEHQNVLLRALGRIEDVEIDLTEVPIAPGDQLMLCSDGLTRTVTDDQLAATLGRYRGHPQAACDHLVELANTNGGPDNVTVVVVEFGGSLLSGLFQRLKT